MRFVVVPSDFTGNVEGSGTIQPALRYRLVLYLLLYEDILFISAWR